MPRADKRAAIIAGALQVFARDGYSRASIDVIAAEAAVSTRTIYNHFPDKAQLFQAVILHSATGVARDQIAIVDRHLSKVTDLEQDLVEFGLAWASPIAGTHATHFDLVRQVNAEAGHIPREAVAAWQEAGPALVRRALAERLQRLVERGQLRPLPNPDQAALHLMQLVSVSNPSYPRDTPSEDHIAELVVAGVHAFLYGYRA